MTESKRVLSEISSKFADKVIQWMKYSAPSEFPFDYLFGENKWRILVPYKNEKVDIATLYDPKNTKGYPVEIVLINNLARMNMFAVDYKEGTVLKEYMKLNPKDNKQYPSKEKFTIGTYLNRILKTYNKMSDEQKIEFFDKLATECGEGMKYFSAREVYDSNLGEHIIKVLPPEEIWQKIHATKLFEVLFGKKKADAAPETEKDAPDILNWWNQNSFRYMGENADKKDINQNYVMMVSRHPLDVMRMSDWSKLKSCHAEGNSYFYCALQEAQGHGPIVWLIDRSTADYIEKNDLLQVDEIFRDPERNVGYKNDAGVSLAPLGRVRLREFYNRYDYYSIALPEGNTYGLGYGEESRKFLNNVYRWLHEVQDPVLPEGLLRTDKIDMSQFSLYGGEYEDSDAKEYFQKYFSEASIEGHYRNEPEENLGSGIEFDKEYIDVQIRQFEKNSNMFSLGFTIEDSGDDSGYISYWAFWRVEILFESMPSVELDKEYFQSWAGDYKKQSDLARKLNAGPLSFRPEELEVEEVYGDKGLDDKGETIGLVFKGYVEIDPEYEQEDGRIDSVIAGLKYDDRKYDETIEFLTEYLLDEGILVDKRSYSEELIETLRSFKIESEMIANGSPNAVRANIELVPITFPVKMLPKKFIKRLVQRVTVEGLGTARLKIDPEAKQKIRSLAFKLLKNYLEHDMVNLREDEPLSTSVYEVLLSNTTPRNRETAKQKLVELVNSNAEAFGEKGLKFQCSLGEVGHKVILSIRSVINSRNAEGIKELDASYDQFADSIFQNIYDSIINESLVDELGNKIIRQMHARLRRLPDGKYIN